MASTFHVPSGRTITASLYIQITDGALPASSGISLNLKNNGTSFITLSNPTETASGSGYYRLDFSVLFPARAERSGWQRHQHGRCYQYRRLHL